MNLSRRGFLGGLLARPALVRSGVLMPISRLVIGEEIELDSLSGILNQYSNDWSQATPEKIWGDVKTFYKTLAAASQVPMRFFPIETPMLPVAEETSYFRLMLLADYKIIT